MTQSEVDGLLRTSLQWLIKRLPKGSAVLCLTQVQGHDPDTFISTNIKAVKIAEALHKAADGILIIRAEETK